MAIDGGMRDKLTIGTVLVAKYKKQEHRLQVVAVDPPLYQLVTSGKTFKSPSAAGSAVMGGIACNGWRFWSLATDATPAPEVEDGPLPNEDDVNTRSMLAEGDRALPSDPRKASCEVCGADVDKRGLKGHLAKHEREAAAA